MSELLTLDDISSHLSVTRVYARDTLVKRPDFPRPSVALSQKARLWSRDSFVAWLEKQNQQQAR